MNFPEFNETEFSQYLYTLWPSPKCTIDLKTAALNLGVSTNTLRRWLSNKQRIPLTVWRLTWLLASGELPGNYNWHNWLFTSRWNETTKTHIHRLVAPNNIEYSAGEILSWHFKNQQLKQMEKDITNLRETLNRERSSGHPALATVSYLRTHRSE